MLVSDIIKASMRKLGVIASGEPLTADAQQDALSALQSMLRSWSAEKINVFSSINETLVLTPGTHVYTWGVGGSINTARPNQIIGASINSTDGITSPVEVIGEGRYISIALKTTSGSPYLLFPKYNYPYVQVTLYPVPAIAETLNLYSIKPFTEASSFDSVDDELQMPAIYEEPTIYNLAVRIAPEFGVAVKASVAAMATSSYNRIVNLNAGNYVEPVRIVLPAGIRS